MFYIVRNHRATDFTLGVMAFGFFGISGVTELSAPYRLTHEAINVVWHHSLIVDFDCTLSCYQLGYPIQNTGIEACHGLFGRLVWPCGWCEQ